MGGARAHKTAYLTLDEFTVDPELARRLPSDLAWRCHALPLAEDNGQLTVAMADPEDVEAREEVIAALGPGSCVIRGSPRTIDARLAEIWGNEARRPIELRVCAFPNPVSDEVWDYARALGSLLAGHVCSVSTVGELRALSKEGAAADCDLLIFEGRDHPLIRHLLQRQVPGGRSVSQRRQVPFALLSVRRPHWPLRRILLVICGQEGDEAAVDWTVRLAWRSGATATVLAVVPPVPEMYHGLARMEQSLAALLSTDTKLGRQLHQTVRHLIEWQVEATLCLRQGAPDQEICREVVKGDPDLIVMATRPGRCWLRHLQGDPIRPLLSRVDRPMLLTEPGIA